MTGRALAGATLAFVVLAGPGLAAWAQEAPAREGLKLLAPARVGDRERIELEASQTGTSRHLEVAIDRTVLEVADALGTREELALSGLRVTHGDGTRVEWHADAAVVATITRAGKARAASGLALDDLAAEPTMLALVRRDPDALARVLEPPRPVSAGESWDVDAKTLLRLYGPEDAKLVTAGSTARAKLEAVETDKGKPEARVTLEAQIAWHDPANKARKGKLKVWATLRGPFDASGPPRKEDLEVQLKLPDGSKETWKTRLVRHHAG